MGKGESRAYVSSEPLWHARGISLVQSLRVVGRLVLWLCDDRAGHQRADEGLGGYKGLAVVRHTAGVDVKVGEDVLSGVEGAQHQLQVIHAVVHGNREGVWRADHHHAALCSLAVPRERNQSAPDLPQPLGSVAGGDEEVNVALCVWVTNAIHLRDACQLSGSPGEEAARCGQALVQTYASLGWQPFLDLRLQDARRLEERRSYPITVGSERRSERRSGRWPTTSWWTAHPP